MVQRVRTQHGPQSGVPEWLGRRGTAAVARDRIVFQPLELPAAAGAIVARTGAVARTP